MAQQDTSSTTAPDILFIGFADNKVPEFKEVRSKDYIFFGEDNLFPNTLLTMYDKSSNHNAIIDGKTDYIVGKGFPIAGTSLTNINRKGQDLNTVVERAVKDIELFGGMYLQVIWKVGGGCEISHMPFQCLRKDKNGDGWWYKKNWKSSRDKPEHIPCFDPKKRKGSQIFEYSEYRPGCDEYPLPAYFGGLNDIETDVEISKYNLSVIKQGMFSSKMIVFNTGDPGTEAKRKIQKDFNEKFCGSGSAGRVMMVFNTDPAKAPVVQDLSTTDLDKLFDQLNKTTQSEIFTCHRVTSPMLFGVKTEGQLGGKQELADAYEIFKNTYVNAKQQKIEQAISWIFPLFGQQPMQLIPVSPVEVTPASAAMDTSMPTGNSAPVNDHVKNMTGKQSQNLHRIIRQFKQGKLTRAQAAQMLSQSFGFGEEDIAVWLDDHEPVIMSKEYTEDEVADMFETVGVVKQEFTIVKSRPYKFEEHYDEFADINETDSSILNLIGKDKYITPEVIAYTLKLDPAYVAARIKSLTKAGILTSSEKTVGIDTVTERAVNRDAIGTIEPPSTVGVEIKYSYEPRPGLEPIIETTRKFCRKLLALDRLYTRGEIEAISERVGFSVWDRSGGWWGSSPKCRHQWVKNVVIKKNK